MDSPFFFDNTLYWSEGDERAHFEWLDRIVAVREVKGRGARVYLHIDAGTVTRDDVVELEAIYRRYGGDLEQLRDLKEAMNAPNK